MNPLPLDPPDLPALTVELVDLELEAEDRHAATRRLAALLAATGRVDDLDGFLTDVRAREALMATGLEGGIGIPHARSRHVRVPSLAVGRSAAGVDYGAPDGPAHLIFLIAVPEGAGADHLTLLSSLARRLVHASFRDALHSAPDAASVVAVIEKEVLGL